MGERQKPRYGASPEMIAVVSLAGIMAEIDEYADAEGGAADLAQLQSIFDGARMSQRDVLDTTRWAALQAHLLLKRESGALEEGCPNVYESRRKNRVEPTLLERLLVRPPRRDLDDPVEYDRSEGFTVPWTEDDVPTLALGVTACFLWYALTVGI